MPSAFAGAPRGGAAVELGSASSVGRGALAAGLLAAALAGGLIALAGLVLLDRVGMLPVGGAPEETAAVRGQVAALEQELEADRQAAELDRENLQTQLADLNERFAQLAERAPADTTRPETGLDEEVARLQAALAELREQVGGATPPAALEDVDARLQQVEELAARVGGLAEQVEALQGAPGAATAASEQDLDNALGEVSQLRAAVDELRGADPRQEIAALQSDVQGLQSGLSALQDQLAATASAEQFGDLEALLADVSRQAARAEALAPAIAAEALSDALSAGRPFSDELQAMQALGVEDPELSQLEPYAEAGLPSRAQLRRRFSDTAQQISDMEAPPPSDAGPLERLLQSARNVVEVRPAGPQQGASAGAVASRIEAALATGDLARALEEWQDLPPDAQAASQDWADQAGAVLAGEALAARLRREALARLASERG
ncbi:MAG TPA: hypothetical protein VHG92_07180 [Afifellaceae bacterium]|nr:hypothetical protein [Afifellaceae bacterium]